MAYDIGVRIPSEGPQIIPLPINLTVGVPFILDLNYIRQFLAPNISISQILSMAGTLNSTAPDNISLSFETGQRIGMFPLSSAYGLLNFVPVLIQHDNMRLRINLTGGLGDTGILTLFICNELICGLQGWS